MAAPATAKTGMLSAHPGLFLSYPAAAQAAQRLAPARVRGPASSSEDRPFGRSRLRFLPQPPQKTRSATGLRVFGAGDRDRTGTMFPSADFKSAASANFATPTNFSAFSLPQPAGKCKGGAKKSGGAGQYDTALGRCAPQTPVCPKNEANRHPFASSRQLLQHRRAGDALRRGPSGSPRGVVRGLGRFETPKRALGTFARSKVPSSSHYARKQVLI